MNPASLRNEAAIFMARARDCADQINQYPELTLHERCEWHFYMIWYEDAAERRLHLANELERGKQDD